MPLKFYDEGLEIQINGDSEIISDLDLQVKAIKTLIESLDFKSAKKSDREIEQKTYLILLDVIGSLLKIDIPGFDHGETANIETVHQFLSQILKQEVHKQPGYIELLDKECDCD